jgi:Caspase domain
MPTIYVRNVTSNPKRIRDPQFTFGTSVEIKAFDELPQNGPAILYILAHAVPNGLRVENSKILKELTLAKELLAARKSQPTLVIFDACFADSFDDIPDFTWPEEFGLIFSCLAHERSWNDEVDESTSESVFPQALDAAISVCRRAGSFEGLKDALLSSLTAPQTPVVRASDALLLQLLSAPPGPASKSAPPKAAE